VITDNRMMRSESGLDLTQELVRRDPQVVIMLTGYPTEDVARQFLSIGGFYFACKGDDTDELVSVLKWAAGAGCLLGMRSEVHILADDMGLMLWELQKACDGFHRIMSNTSCRRIWATVF